MDSYDSLLPFLLAQLPRLKTFKVLFRVRNWGFLEERFRCRV